MKTCENCGSNVYKLGCIHCDEENYIEEQKYLTDLQYGRDRTQPEADAAEILSPERSTPDRPREKSVCINNFQEPE